MEHHESYRGHFTVNTKNSAQCKLCGDVISSLHVHDFKSCLCGEIAVDGGDQYIKRVAKEMTNVIELSEYRNYTIDEIKFVKSKAINDMRKIIYSQGYYLNLIEASEYFAEKWYSCKI
jgi:hypothetical protein